MPAEKTTAERINQAAILLEQLKHVLFTSQNYAETESLLNNLSVAFGELSQTDTNELALHKDKMLALRAQLDALAVRISKESDVSREKMGDLMKRIQLQNSYTKGK